MKNGVKSRRKDLDSWRGLAVLLMLVFHGYYNLHSFQLVSMDLSQWSPWWWLRFFIANSFLFLAGMGLALGHSRGLSLAKFLRWWLPIAAGALLISLATRLLLSNSWIFFGILHLIATAALLAWPLSRQPRLAFVLALLLLALYLFTPYWQLSHWWPEYRSALGLPNSSLDYYPLLPHGISLLLGMALANILPKRDLLAGAQGPISQSLTWLGLHALSIYLLHQAILYPAAYGLYLLQRS